MVIAPLVWLVLAQAPTMSLTGTVVGPGGEPVVGAEIILVGMPSYEAPIVARGKSGESGKFSIMRPATLVGDHHAQRAPILWALKPGYLASTTRFPEAMPKPEDSVQIVLKPPGKAEVRVEGPDGRPAGDVRVLPGRLRTDFTNIPDAVAEIIAATTGVDGVAVFDAIAPDDLAYIDVHSRELGIQGKNIPPAPGKPVTIALRPVSTWKGRLSAVDPKNARGWKVRAWTRVGGGSDAEPLAAGYAERTTDDEGRFTLAPMAVGSLQLDLKPPGDLPVIVDLPKSLAVREGLEESAEIPLREGVTITGLVLERGTGKPVSDVAATLIYIGGGRNGSLNVKTDEKGRYTFQCLPGLVRVGHFRYPKTHVPAPVRQDWEDFTVSEPAKLIELATREVLPAAPPLRGKIVDESGRAVPGASFVATWRLDGGGGNSGASLHSKADDDGNFLFDGIGPGSTVTITAKHQDRQTPGPVQFQAGEVGPVTITITKFPAFAVAGRVIEPSGAPLADVSIQISFWEKRPNLINHPDQAKIEVRSGPDGSFQTLKELEQKPGVVRAEINAPGFFPTSTAWIPATSDVVTLPDLTLKRQKGLRVVSGRVADREGKSLVGVSVSQSGDGPRWTSTRSDADGQFRLDGVLDGPALVLAEANGFRPGGAVVGVRPGAVEIRLARVTEPPIATLKTLSPLMSRAEERALARELLEPLLPMAQSGTLGAYNGSIIPALARVDPARVLEMIENRVIGAGSLALMQVALGQFEDDPTLAIAAIEDDSDPGSRAACWLALEDFRPSLDRARREDFLGRALTDARKATSPDAKIQLLGQIADRWLGLGSIDRARPILLEAQAIASAGPRETWSHTAEEMGEVLAAIDLPAAIALFQRRGKTNVSATDSSTIAAHKGQAALRLATIDPAGAERLIEPSSPSFYGRPRIVLELSRRMAKSDLPRARRILEMVDDQSSPGLSVSSALIPFGLGRIAGELAGSDPEAARKLLDEAFARLRTSAVEGRTGQRQESIANLMADLLPIVERIEPDRLAERIWLIVGSRAPTPSAAQSPRADNVEATFALAMLVSRYDRAIAGAIAASLVERLPDLMADTSQFYSTINSETFKNLAAYDPRTIAPILRALPDAARKVVISTNDQPTLSSEAMLRLAAAEILGFPNRTRPWEAGRQGNPPSYRIRD